MKKVVLNTYISIRIFEYFVLTKVYTSGQPIYAEAAIAKKHKVAKMPWRALSTRGILFANERTNI